MRVDTDDGIDDLGQNAQRGSFRRAALDDTGLGGSTMWQNCDRSRPQLLGGQAAYQANGWGQGQPHGVEDVSEARHIRSSNGQFVNESFRPAGASLPATTRPPAKSHSRCQAAAGCGLLVGVSGVW